MQELKEIRQRGYAIDNGEHETHVYCIAAPIRDHRGIVIAASSVSVPDIRTHLPMIGSPLANQVLATAKSISEILGYVNNKQTISK